MSAIPAVVRGQGLAQSLPSRFALIVTVGGIIGLGILRNPGEIAAVIPDPWYYLALWLLFGLFVLLTTAVVAELVGMTPRSGGTYALVRHAYGPFPGFVIGWVDWLSFAADIALKAVVIVEFIGLLAPVSTLWQTPWAIAVTSAFAALQLRGIALSGAFQQLVISLVGLAICAFSMMLFFTDPVIVSVTDTIAEPRTGIRAWSLVFTTIIFTYDGWFFASYFSGETRGGAGAVARACLKGVVIVIALYLLLNAAMISSVPLPILAGNELMLARALELAMSPAAAKAVVVAAILILISQQNQGYMGAPRILQALSVDGLGMKQAQRTGKGGNPVFAVLVTWVLAVGLILIGGFEFLMTLCVFFFVPLYLALIVGVLVLRRREPDTDRPYRAWGHPYSTAFVLAGWTVITAFQAYAERETLLFAAVMVAISWPTYRYLTRKAAP